MGKSAQLTLSAELQSLSKFRDLVKTTCTGISDEIVYDIQLAVDELCTNIIMHGYKDMDPGSITMQVDVSTNNVLVSITDFGQPFEPVEPPTPNPHATAEEREIGGLGLFFIHMSVDDIQYESSSTGNVTRLIKKL